VRLVDYLEERQREAAVREEGAASSASTFRVDGDGVFAEEAALLVTEDGGAVSVAEGR
jgi:hypothetical protein